MANRVKICGIDTTRLPKLSNEEMENLLIETKKGNKNAKKQLIVVTTL